MNTYSKIYAIGACRTAIGNFEGTLKDVPAAELGSIALKEAVTRSGITLDDIEEVTTGCCLQAGLGQNISRQVALKAGIPIETTTQTINKVCGSGLRAVILAAQSILVGDAQCTAATGLEKMSSAPYLLKSQRWGSKMGDITATDSMIHDGLWDIFNDVHMGITAENVAERYSITREAQDKFSYESQMKAARAIETGAFKDEIVPVVIPQRKGNPVTFDTDEHVRRDTTVEKLAKLRPAFKAGGTVTAGNSSGLNDAAAAVIVADDEFISSKNIKPLFRIVSWGSVGVDPAYMGIGPVPSILKALKKAEMKLEDIQCVELNEAFASQSLAVIKELGLNPDIVNPNGGAIALGHPIGASGLRILVTLYYDMLKAGQKYGLASLCIGGGMGEAVIIERDESCK